MFRQGQKLGFVGDNDNPNGLRQGQTYVFEGYCKHTTHDCWGRGVYIVGISLPEMIDYHDCMFENSFRPLVTTDISIFEQMLVDPPKQLIREDV